ncbi:MAG: branched-chain amino acid ABC transporter permease [Nitrospira sp.]|nr:branched-chain amino acid ABC transporter permease [Nitrospira sp.]
MSYIIHLLIYFDIYVIVALSLNLVVGYCGLLTLSHASFYAVGAYAYAILSLVLGWDILPIIFTAIVVGAALSLLLSIMAWRLRGDFFVLASLAVQSIVFGLIYNWSDGSSPLGSWNNFTNGAFGIASIDRPKIFQFVLTDSTHFLIFATIVTGLCALIVWRLCSSPWGQSLIAMREDELAARSLGKNTKLLKVQALAIASGMVAVAGTLYAGYVSYIDVSSASLDENILMLSMVIVGGLGNIRGPIIGAIAIILIPEFLRFLDISHELAANFRLAIYGLLLVLMMHFRPQGIGGEYRLE